MGTRRAPATRGRAGLTVLRSLLSGIVQLAWARDVRTTPARPRPDRAPTAGRTPSQTAGSRWWGDGSSLPVATLGLMRLVVIWPVSLPGVGGLDPDRLPDRRRENLFDEDVTAGDVGPWVVDLGPDEPGPIIRPPPLRTLTIRDSVTR